MRLAENLIFGKNLNRLRTVASLTQEALAEKADVSRRFLQEIEAGEKAPTVPVVARLRRALKCTWEDFFRGL